MGRLDNKIISIVGAAGEGNMGQVMARRFAAEGAKVIVSGRNESSLRKLAEEIDGDWVFCDFAKKTSIILMIDTIIERHSRLDVAVNATGWGLFPDRWWRAVSAGRHPARPACGLQAPATACCRVRRHAQT